MFKSIFSDENENPNSFVPLPHLQLNVKAREQTLQNLQDKIYFEQNLLENKNASYVSVLMKEYRTKVNTMQYLKMQEELKIKSTNFESIFHDENFIKEEKEKRESEKVRDEYFQKYIQQTRQQEGVKKMLQKHTKTQYARNTDLKHYKVQINGPYLSKQVNEEPENNTLQEIQIYRMNQLEKQYDMYKLMLEDMFDENEELIQRTSNNFVCKNQKLIEVMEPMVVGTIAVYSDEICEALIDEMLEQSVYQLNRIEEYKQTIEEVMKRTEAGHKELLPVTYKKTVPYHLFQAIQSLDDYADD